jgi:hypothetical protein
MVSGNLENGTVYSMTSAGIKASGGTIAADLTGEGGLTFDPVTNSVVRLSGYNSFSGVIKLGTTNNQALQVTRAESLSPNADLSGGSSFANTPTLSLLAEGEYAVNRYSDGNMIFNGTSTETTRLTFTSAEGSTIAGGNKMLTATNVSIVFQGPVELAPNQADKTIALAGNGNFTFRGPIVNSIPSLNAGITITNSGNVFLEAANSYNGATVIQMGALIVAADGALPTTSAVTVNSGAKLKFNKASGEISVGAMTVAGTLEQNLVTINSSGAVDLTGSTLMVSGTPTLESYTLVQGSSVTGTPTLSGATGYQLIVDSASVKLVKSVAGSTYSKYFTSGSENEVGSNGLTNLMNYALGQNGPNAPFPAVPVLSADSNGMTLAATARTDDSSLRFYVEWTTDLSGVDDSWHATEVFAPNLTGTIEYGGLRKFLRFRVTK